MEVEEEDKYYSYCNPPGYKWAILRHPSGHIFVNGLRIKQKETHVIEGDFITTGEDGYGEVMWPDASVTIVGSNAKFTVEDLFAGG